MKTQVLSLITLSLLLCSACQSASTPKEVSTQLERAGDNKAELENFLAQTPEEQKEGAFFLIQYMPQEDLQTLSSAFLSEHLRYAYLAKENFPWCRTLPDSIFLNEVLPYAFLDEKRESWRKAFYDNYAPLLKDASSIEEALSIIQEHITEISGVSYNTKREKANQGPYESIKQGMASCTGLSILLGAVARSVGIPMRLAGCPLWYDNSGNHNWNEVWLDGAWYFTEYNRDSQGLNRAWFLRKAAQADANHIDRAIYASSYKTQNAFFPLVWDKENKTIPAYNVSAFYQKLYQAQTQQKELSPEQCLLKVVVSTSKADSSSTHRLRKLVLIKHVNGEKVAEGYSPGPQQDMNDVLYLIAQKNTAYIFEIDGKTVLKYQATKQEEQTIILPFHPHNT